MLSGMSMLDASGHPKTIKALLFPNVNPTTEGYVVVPVPISKQPSEQTTIPDYPNAVSFSYL